MYAGSIRWCQFTHGHANEFGGGQWEPAGLTDLGCEMVAHMNRLGIICDPTHLSQEGMLDMIRASDDPVLVSHIGCRSVHPGYARYRNITDKGIKAAADKGGVIGISNVPNCAGGHAIHLLIQHIDHVVQLVGAHHVAVGTDHDMFLAAEPPELVATCRPQEWNTGDCWDLTLATSHRKSNLRNPTRADWRFWTEPSALSHCNWPYIVTVALVCHGYRDEDIRNIIGGNVVRVARPILSGDRTGTVPRGELQGQ